MVDEQNSTVTNETDTGSVEPGQRAQLVVVANRLPFDLEVQPDGSTLAKPSPGGLVTALEPILARRRGAWIGWPGTPDVELQPTAADGLTLYPVTLSRDEVDEYYEGFSNATLWPLYHDAVADSEFHREWWEAYRRVNARFAERAAQVAAPGATVWVHDYQLQLVPQLLRALRPDVRIGFFLHIPFPPAELYQRLPWRAPLLAGMLGADLIGFQLSGGTRNFLRLARTLLGAPTTSRTVTHEGRTVRVGAFPISIDSRALAELAGTEQVQRTARELRAELGNPQRLILGVDRLDYTKGIDVRLQAFGELLAERDPAVADAVMVQIATPSRERLASYVATRENIERQVGALNGDFGRIGRPAVHYLHQSLPRQDLTAFYVAADVMTVTPLRDGMNLVAKEYVACRVRGDGVLLLSEFTGAARELRAALQVNPYDTDGVKEALRTALTMPSAQAGRRMRSLRRQVLTHHVDRWASLFLSALEGGDQLPVGVLRPEQVKLIETLAAAPRLLVATDFDGTMAPLVDDPAAATAAPGSVEALRSLASTPNTVVAVVSGRSLNDLRELLGDTDGLHLIGSHGIEIDRSINSPTELLSAQQTQLLSRLQDRAAQIVDEEPGTRLEPKPFGVAVHVRGMDPVAAQAVVDRLRNGPARWQGVHLMHGKMVVELTVLRADKGTAISRLAELNGCTTIVFLGDDVTDERAFAVLGLEDAGIKVGPGPSSAGHRLADPAQVGQWLSRLAEARSRLLEGVSAS